MGRVLVRELAGPALLQIALGEHGGGDLAARHVDDRRGLTGGQADRIEHEHVALERAQPDAALGHRVDERVVRDPFEQRELADHAVVRFQTGW